MIDELRDLLDGDEPTTFFLADDKLNAVEYVPMADYKRVIEERDRFEQAADENLRRAIDAEAKCDRLREAALAYQELATCYRIGKRPTEKLFKRLEQARAALQEAGDE